MSHLEVSLCLMGLIIGYECFISKDSYKVRFLYLLEVVGQRLAGNCTARQCSPLRRKFMERSIINSALSLLMKHLVIGQRQKAHNFSAFHFSPHGSLVSIGQHFVTTRVVYLPKRTETTLITESNQSGPNHELLQLCTAHTAWSESHQAVRAVHSCNSWFTRSSRAVSGRQLIPSSVLLRK